MLRRFGVAVLCVGMLGIVAGCKTRHDADQGSRYGARRSAINREPTLRVRIGRGVDRVRLNATDRLKIGPANATRDPKSYATPVVIRREADAFVVESSDSRPVRWPIAAIEVITGNSGVVRVEGVAYPHRLVLHAVGPNHAGTGRFDLINRVPLEWYLPGVLDRELFANWHPMAYRAQAIAARSYAIDQAARHPDRHYDVEATEADQVYGGISTRQVSLDAVRDTRGLVLTYQDHILPAFYSSCSGGVGQDAWVAFPNGPTIEPLRGRRQGVRGAASPNYQWGPITRDLAALAIRIKHWGIAKNHQTAQMSGIRRIEVSGTSSAGRPAGFRITDSTGRTFHLPAESFRFAANQDPVPGLKPLPDKAKLKSSFLRVEIDGRTARFTGRGSGHGVGMCQWGAQGMAIRGSDAEEILGFFYPGADLVRAY